jgi:ferredoxin/flavodoxin
MKTAIYYFTGTGNSLAVAKELAKELGGAEIFPISRIMAVARGTDKKFSPSADRIIIIYPVYASGLPRIVADFASRLKAEGKKLYGIATYGGMAGKVNHLLKKQLKEAGNELTAGFLVRMPGNCITLYPAVSKSKQDELFRVAKLKIKDISREIMEGVEGKIEDTFSILDIFQHGPLHKKMTERLKEADKEFYSTDNCDACGLCVNICPVGNIELQDGRPVWKHNCEQCMACIQWCPLEAIQHGTKTIKRKRYRHPEIKSDELVRK